MWREGAGQPVPKFLILTMMLDADDKQLALCGGEKHVFGAKKNGLGSDCPSHECLKTKTSLLSIFFGVVEPCDPNCPHRNRYGKGYLFDPRQPSLAPTPSPVARPVGFSPFPPESAI